MTRALPLLRRRACLIVAFFDVQLFKRRNAAQLSRFLPQFEVRDYSKCGAGKASAFCDGKACYGGRMQGGRHYEAESNAARLRVWHGGG